MKKIGQDQDGISVYFSIGGGEQKRVREKKRGESSLRLKKPEHLNLFLIPGRKGNENHDDLDVSPVNNSDSE